MSAKLKDVSFAKAPNVEFAKTFDNILLQVNDKVEKMCPTHFASLKSLMAGWHKYSRKNRKYSKLELLTECNQEAIMMIRAFSSQTVSSINLLSLKMKKQTPEEKNASQIIIDKLTKINKQIVEKKLAQINKVSPDTRNSGMLDILQQISGYENLDPGLSTCIAELETISGLMDSLIRDKHKEFEEVPVGFSVSQRKLISKAYNNTLPYINMKADSGDADAIKYVSVVQVIVDQEYTLIKSRTTRNTNAKEKNSI